MHKNEVSSRAGFIGVAICVNLYPGSYFSFFSVLYKKTFTVANNISE